jgi:hypothetical protein
VLTTILGTLSSGVNRGGGGIMALMKIIEDKPAARLAGVNKFICLGVVSKIALCSV